MQSTGLIHVIGPIAEMACYIVAVCHDIGHAGTNSDFLLRTNADIATIFGMDAPLERGHVAIFSLLMEQHNFLPDISESDHNHLMEIMLDMTKATDMKAHIQVCADFCVHNAELNILSQACQLGVRVIPRVFFSKLFFFIFWIL